MAKSETLASTPREIETLQKTVTEDKETRMEVLKVMQEINRLNKELSKGYEDMPMNTDLSYYNKRQSYIRHLITEKESELQYIEKMLVAESIKYNSKDFLKEHVTNPITI